MSRARDLSNFVNPAAISVDGSFNVGINSTSPETKLDVDGAVTATSFTGDGSGLTNLPSSGGGGGGISTDSQGNIGIGSTSVLITAPTYNLGIGSTATGNLKNVTGTHNVSMGS